MSEILAGEVTGTIATSVTVGGTSMSTIKTEANTGSTNQQPLGKMVFQQH